MNIVRRIRRESAAHRARPTLIEGDATWTYAAMWDRVDRLSAALHAMGVGKGNVALAWLPNCHEAVETELACLQIGAIWVTLFDQSPWREVAAVVASTEPKVIVTTAEHAEHMPDTGVSAPRVIVTGEELPAGREPFEKLLEDHAPNPPAVETDLEDIARLRYTSGTTGHAKAAMLSHRVYHASLDNLQAELHAMGPDDRVLHVAPLTHATAAMLYPAFAAGGANVILPRFDVDDVLDTIERHKITAMFVVPTILQRLVAAPSITRRDLSSLKTITYGGSPMAVEKLEAAIERFGDALVQIYGLTEALHPVTVLRREEHYVGNPKLGSIGAPATANEVKIVDDSGTPCETGEVGEIWVKGPNIMSGYWRNPEETAAVLHGEWLATGDLAYEDDEGYFWIVDRRKDVVISGGFNVYTKEVEVTLSDHPAVLEAAVIGIPHDDWGEQVHAVVAVRPNAEVTESELTAFCRERLTPYKCPKSIDIRHAPLPKSGAGKILKRELRRPYWEGRKAQVN